jgi:hypothetical protein
MCDRYVLAFSGNVVEFDRASYLMDRDLLDQTIRAMRHEQTTCPRWDARYDEQWVWGYYWERHLEHYGEPFMPNVNPNWDREAPPTASSPARRRRRKR